MGPPDNAKVRVTVTRPTVSVGNVLTQAKLVQPTTVDADTIPPRQATLMALETASHKPVVTYTDETFDLADDPASARGAFEPAGLFGKELKDLLTIEGNYTFHFQASYGLGCTSVRELLCSLHVDVGVDPAHGPDTQLHWQRGRQEAIWNHHNCAARCLWQ